MEQAVQVIGSLLVAGSFLGPRNGAVGYSPSRMNATTNQTEAGRTMRSTISETSLCRRHWKLLPATAIVGLVLAGCSSSGSENGSDLVVLVNDAQTLTEKFCGASQDSEHILVAPLSTLQSTSSISCSDGDYSVLVADAEADPGHIMLNISPPPASPKGLDCDGKADIGVSQAALNCFPSDKESGDHQAP